ncbi:MAG: hypothetical protein WBF58_20740 [Xanthobacteraceae bacterium]
MALLGRGTRRGRTGHGRDAIAAQALRQSARLCWPEWNFAGTVLLSECDMPRDLGPAWGSIADRPSVLSI